MIVFRDLRRDWGVDHEKFPPFASRKFDGRATIRFGVAYSATQITTVVMKESSAGTILKFCEP